MKKRLKKAAALLLAGTMAASLMACGGSQQGTESADKDGAVTLKITWWGSQSRHEYMQKLLDLYTKDHPNVKFETYPSGWDGYFDKMATQAASGTMPDIVQMDYLYISTYAKNNSLVDLQQYVDDGTIDTSKIDEKLLNSGKINDQLAGLVLSESKLCAGYNSEVLEKAGVTIPDQWTWDDFMDVMTKVKDAGYEDPACADPSYDTNIFNYWVRQHGEQLFADDNKSLGYDDDQILTDYLQMWKDAMDNNLAPTPDEYEQINTLGLEGGPVVTNDALTTLTWNNYSTLVANANDKIKLAPMPTLGADDKKGLWLKPGSFYSIAKTSEHPKEAAEFINWFVNSEEANDIIMGEYGTPVNSDIRDYLSSKLTTQQQDMFSYIDDSSFETGETPAPDPSGMAEINKAFKDVCNTAFYGQKTCEEAAKEFRKQANEILERNN